MLATGSIIGRLRPSNTSAALLFTCDEIPVEITTIAVCNVTGSAATFRLFHDPDATTWNETTALYFDKSVPANDTIWIRAESAGAGIQMVQGDSVGVRSSTGNALNFTAYGVTPAMAKPVQMSPVYGKQGSR